MKLRKLNKLGIMAIAASSLATISLPLVTSCGANQKKDDKIKEEYFEIVNGEIKGFKQTVTKDMLKEYCKDGILRLPAAKSIGANAFNAEMLKDAPFATTIEIQNSTTKIGERAFYANTATTVTFTGEGKSQLVEIDDSAFAFCSKLTSFKFPEAMFTNASIIQDSAFFGCSALTAFDCSEYTGETQVTPQWAFGAFKGTNDAGNVIFNGSDLVTTAAVKSNYASLWSRLVFAGVKPAWNECWNDTETQWAKQVKAVPVEYLKIVDGELQGANERIWPITDTNFNAVITPDTVTTLSSTIKTDFFSKRTSVTTWSFTASEFEAIPDGAFNGLDSGVAVDLWLPSSVKTIGDNAFKSCKWNVIFATYDNITSIGANAFDSSSITQFTFATGITSVGNSAFANCASLTTLDFSAWTAAPTWTGTGLFTNTGSTTSTSNYKVKIKTKTNTIDQWELKELHKTYLNTKGMTINAKTGNTWTFDPVCDVEYNQIFKIESGVLKGWATNSNGTELTKAQVATIFDEHNFGTTLTLPTTVTSIDSSAFYASSASKLPDCVTKIVINDECTSIGANAFSGATKVTEVVIPKNATAIADSAFSGCTSLASIDLSHWDACPAWTGTGIFTGCADKGSVKVKTITNQVDQWRFNNPVRALLKNNGISTWDKDHWQFDKEDEATLLKVESGAVVGWSSGATTALTDAEKLQLAKDKHGGAVIVIPKEATSIADTAFVKDTITSTIPSTLPTVQFEASSTCVSIGKRAFYKAPITTLDMTNATSLTTVDEHAFSGSGITSLTLTSSLTTVNAGAFFQTQLAKIVMPVFTNTITFGAGAFANNANLSEIDLSAYTALPTWVDDTYSLFDNIKNSGTIKVKSALSSTIMAYMSQHSNSIAYYEEWTVTTV